MGWPHNAYVGQKVVCIRNPKIINESGREWDHPSAINKLPGPILNNIYTIRSIFIYKGIIGFRLEEIFLSECCIGEKGWRFDRFRPLQSTDKGMEVLKGLLNPVNHKVLEDA